MTNYLNIGNYDYLIATKNDIYEVIVKELDRLKAVFYDCNDIADCIKFGNKVKELLRLRKSSRIMLIGMVKKEDLEKNKALLKSAGFVEILTKPFDHDAFNKMLKE